MIFEAKIETTALYSKRVSTLYEIGTQHQGEKKLLHLYRLCRTVKVVL